VALLWHDGIRAIRSALAAMTLAQRLHDFSSSGFQLQGGTVESGYRYEPSTNDFSVATAR